MLTTKAAAAAAAAPEAVVSDAVCVVSECARVRVNLELMVGNAMIMMYLYSMYLLYNVSVHYGNLFDNRRVIVVSHHNRTHVFVCVCNVNEAKNQIRSQFECVLIIITTRMWSFVGRLTMIACIVLATHMFQVSRRPETYCN